MWDSLDFHRPEAELVGEWHAQTEEGNAVFMLAEGGGFAGSFESEGHEESFWGTWALDGDELTFSATDEAWEAGAEPDFKDHGGTLDDVDGDTMTTTMEGLSDEPIEWERVSVCPLVGEWVGEPDGNDVTIEFNDDGTFSVSMEGEHDAEFSGIWTVVGPGVAFLAVIDSEMQPTVMHFIMTSTGEMMLGENEDDLTAFGRQ